MTQLYKDRWNKKVGGVFGGVGRFFAIDPTILRMGFVVLALFTGILPVVFLYLIAWAVMPIGPKTYVQFSSKQLYRSIRDRKIAGICGGIAEMLGISATICRILFGALLLLTGIVPLTIAYLIGIGVIPEKPRFP